MKGVQLNSYQRALALDEYYKLIDYVEELEQLTIPAVVGRSEQCCSPAKGFYLGVTCPKCNKIFRSVNAE